MPVRTVELVLAPGDAANENLWPAHLAKKLRIEPERLKGHRLLKRSLDARKAPVRFRLRFEVGVDEDLEPALETTWSAPSLRSNAKKIIIVGCGPAGMFAALRCLELGHKPIILERGKDASARRFDLAPIMREGRVIEESNYCFGEGGAGTFSDGKLYTRAKKRGPVAEIYRTLVAHGAPENILVEAHPHIGSNLLPKVVMAMRESVIAAGGEVHFESKVTEFLLDGGQMTGVATADGREFRGSSVILATGHSARDIYELLHEQKILLEAKPFAVGVRIEHPQGFIDQAQYHLKSGEKRDVNLPASRYALATTVKGRSVHSFCMCPGGFVVPAATENDEVVVNGMSLSRRDSPFANSGMVVGIEPGDLPGDDVLRGIRYQKKIEQLAKEAGGGGQVAPAQRVTDFLAGKLSKALPETSYFPGLKSVRLDEILPKHISERLAGGLRKFGKMIRGYTGPDALLIGFETRTSSPVRIPRGDDLQHPEVSGLYPCGEGAGYAGGIVSAALDGRRCAEAALEE
ncbi:FAD-binding protein [Akkermansiaceae bacterium]|nr:FAD-binding protein [Akkermansiaceae bacterium]